MTSTPPKMTRDVWVRGVGLLLQLLKDDLVLARAIKQRRYKDLYAAVIVANSNTNPRMAAADPAQYEALQRAKTLFFIKGYRCLDHSRLQKLIEKESAA